MSHRRLWLVAPRLQLHRYPNGSWQCAHDSCFQGLRVPVCFGQSQAVGKLQIQLNTSLPSNQVDVQVVDSQTQSVRDGPHGRGAGLVRGSCWLDVDDRLGIISQFRAERLFHHVAELMGRLEGSPPSCTELYFDKGP